jgi:hypothetical protein
MKVPMKQKTMKTLRLQQAVAAVVIAKSRNLFTLGLLTQVGHGKPKW